MLDPPTYAGTMRLTLTTHGVPPMSPGERVLLSEALRQGNRVFWSLQADPREGMPGLDKAREFLFRRWVLEALLALQIQGPSGYNSLALALGGPAGESLAPKLDALRAATLVSRSVTASSPPRVQYALTPTGEQIGAGVYLLTRWKGLQALAAQDHAIELPGAEDLGKRLSLRSVERRAAFERYLKATSALGKTREAYCRPVEFEDALAMTRRFCRAWVHKWHSRILLTLALGGPMRFADLRLALGIGDQALSVALAGLLDLRSVQLGVGSGGKQYAVTPFGWSDLVLSVPLALLVLETSGPRPLEEGSSP